MALLVETSFGSGRDILMGIASYLRDHEPWLLFHEASSIDQELPHWLKRWKGHGIIARNRPPTSSIGWAAPFASNALYIGRFA